MQIYKLFPFLAIVPLLGTSIAAYSFNGINSSPVTSTPIEKKSSLEIAQQSRVRRLRFARGAFETTVEDAVVMGTRDIYLVGARKGQTMTVKISSFEQNAVFEVKTPPTKSGQRRSLKPEAIRWTGTLPETGDYQLIIGSLRGNATYKLQVSIK